MFLILSFLDFLEHRSSTLPNPIQHEVRLTLIRRMRCFENVPTAVGVYCECVRYEDSVVSFNNFSNVLAKRICITVRRFLFSGPRVSLWAVTAGKIAFLPETVHLTNRSHYWLQIYGINTRHTERQALLA